MRRGAALMAAAIGILLGAAGRNVPIAIAFWLAGRGHHQSCGMQAAVDCAFRDMPDVIGALIKFVLILVALSAAMAVVGMVMIVIASTRVRQPAAPRRVAGLLAVLTAGTALVVPGLFLLVSFVAFSITK